MAGTSSESEGLQYHLFEPGDGTCEPTADEPNPRTGVGAAWAKYGYEPNPTAGNHPRSWHYAHECPFGTVGGSVTPANTGQGTDETAG